MREWKKISRKRIKSCSQTGRRQPLIKGNDLHVNRLTLEKGEVDVEGRIDSLAYSDAGGGKKAAESLLGRIFR